MDKKWDGVLQIAIYGKGGIGKSTTSSNISYMMSKAGIKVLQIGCDPKHDSTRSLLDGKVQPTVLESLDIKSTEHRDIKDLVVDSDCGVSCVECGGPAPGIGCAGRGIITAMNELRRCGLKKEEYDVILYDVLGDVVCGGFAVPLRKEYADVVYLVTSEEFMAVYAANNIIRGISNHSGDRPRIGGIIFNSRSTSDDGDLVRRFSEAVGVPIICRIPRDPLFAVSEKEGRTVSEMFPGSEPSEQYRRIVENITGQVTGEVSCYPADPLSDTELDMLLKGKPLVRERTSECPLIRLKPSNGEACAARHATGVLSAVKDLTIVVHGPRACGYSMCNIHDMHFIGHAKEDPDFDRTYADAMVCTDMVDSDSIFGGSAKLKALLEKLCSDGVRNIAVVTACIPGIIGDDVASCIKEIGSKYEGTTILDVRTDGNLTGSAADGIRMARSVLTSLIDMDVVPEKNVVNVIANFGHNPAKNKKRTEELLRCVGYEINGYLFNDSTMDGIRKCRRASVCFAASKMELAPQNRAVFESCGMKVSDRLIPNGVVDTLAWLEDMRTPDNSESIDGFIAEKTSAYRSKVKESREVLSGKKIVVIGWRDMAVDWIVDALKDADATVIAAVNMGPMAGRPFVTDRHPDVEVLDNKDPREVYGSIRSSGADLVLGGVPDDMDIGCKKGGFPAASVSIDSSTELLEHVCNLMRAPAESGWTGDGDL